jgi:hypothetical protein
VYNDLVVDFIIQRSAIQRRAFRSSEYVKDCKKERHDLGVHGEEHYVPGDLLMLFDHRSAGLKLRPAWRGPFVITGLGGNKERSYTLRQIQATLIQRNYHGNSLKPFRLQEGYLVTYKEEAFPMFQNIRLGNAAFKLPKVINTIPSANIT